MSNGLVQVGHGLTDAPRPEQTSLVFKK